MSDIIRYYKNPKDLIIPEILNSDNYSNLIGMINACQLFNTFKWTEGAINRCNTYETPYNFEYTPLPDNKFTGTFSDACILAANSIWKDPRKKIVLWSGGIDSTCMLIALMQTNSNWEKEIKIVMSQDVEYPWFKNNFLQNADMHIGIPWAIPDLNDYQVINGHPADMLFGLGTNKLLFYDIRNDRYTSMFDRLRTFNKKEYNRIIDDVTYTDAINYIEQFISLTKSIFEVRTVLDLKYWWGFTHMWMHKTSLFPSKTGDISAFENNRNVSFYDTPEFQSWSMINRDLIIKDTWKSYKFIAKDFIFDFTKDNHYNENAIKWVSQLNNINSHPILITKTKFIDKFSFSDLQPALLSCLK